MKPVNLREALYVSFMSFCHISCEAKSDAGKREPYFAHLLTENTLSDDSSAQIQSCKRRVLPISRHHLPSLSPGSQRHIRAHRRDVFEFAQALLIINPPQRLSGGVLRCGILNQILYFLHRAAGVGQFCNLDKKTALQQAAGEQAVLVLLRCSDWETGLEVQNCPGHGLVLHDEELCVLVKLGEAQCIVGHDKGAVLAFLFEVAVPEPFSRQTRTTVARFYQLSL